MESQTEYSADADHVSKVTDTNGAETSYTYTGSKLTQTTAANDTVTDYEYDPDNDRSTKTSIDDNHIIQYFYTKGRLSQVFRNTSQNSDWKWQAYEMLENHYGQTTSISVSSAADETGSPVYWQLSTPMVLAQYAYAGGGGNMTKMIYANGQYVKYYYDLFDRLVHTVYYDNNGTETLTDDTVQASYYYLYNPQGVLSRQYAVEIANGAETGAIAEEYAFEYDSLGRLIRSRENGENNAPVQRTEHLYDAANRLTGQKWVVGAQTFSENYAYNDPTDTNPSADGLLDHVDYPDGSTATNTYNDLKQLTKQQIVLTNSNLFNRQMTYWEGSETNQTTTRLKTWRYYSSSGSTSLISGYTYAYDDIGNITTVWNAATSKKEWAYTYDALGQLTTEKHYDGLGEQTGNIDYQSTVTYDLAGNIISVSEVDRVDGSSSHSYTYFSTGWLDLLRKFDNQWILYEGQSLVGITVVGSPISGNPVRWYNGSTYRDFQWAQGRQLVSLKKGTASISYAYDMEGVRSQKTEGGRLHQYVTQSGRVVRETVTNASTGAFITCLDFFYDVDGNPYVMRQYTNSALTDYTDYYYVLNAQGDVVELISASGTVAAAYTYDAWGRVRTQTGSLADTNPLRYRGYYYDTETGFYYLQSRYYDPIVKRFINADAFASTGQGFLGYNMFAYCGNNPVAHTDPSGSRMQDPNSRDYGGAVGYTDSGTGCWVFPEDGSFIDDQTNFSASSFAFGGETISNCGCGVVAAYNVLTGQGNNIGFYDVYRYACSIHKTPGGLTKEEVLNTIIFFDPSVSISSKDFTSVLVFYGYYSYRIDSNAIEIVERDGGHVAAGIMTTTGAVQMHNAVGGRNFKAFLFSYIGRINGIISPKDSIIGFVETVIPLR